MPDETPPAHRMPISANTHSGTALAMMEATSPRRKPTASSAYAISLEICSHSRQLVGCQIPNFFSRIAGLSPRVWTASKKLFAIVSATVSTADPAMPGSLLCLARFGAPALTTGLIFCRSGAYLTPRFLLFPAPFTPRAGFLGAEIELLDILGMHQPLTCVVHDHPADFKHITIVRGLKCDFRILLDQKNRHALLFVDPPDNGKNLLHQYRRQAKRGFI